MKNLHMFIKIFASPYFLFMSLSFLSLLSTCFFAAMKCFQFLLLLVIFVPSIFTYDPEHECQRGGKCHTSSASFIVDEYYNYTMQEPKRSALCYYYKCRIGEWNNMNGFGTYEDFINTCKYLDPMIKQQIDSSLNVSQKNFVYNDDNLILAICHPNDVKECEKILMDTKTYQNIHVQFDHAERDVAIFYQERRWECVYENAPLPQLPHVQCETSGFCQSGSEFRIFPFHGRFNKTCDACVMFICSSLDGKQVITGSGCYDDFVKACNNTNSSAVARFNEKKDDRDHGIKSNFYYDSNMIVASCSDADNCHKYAFDNYVTTMILFDIFYENVDKNANEKCFYEVTAPTTAPTTAPSVTIPEISVTPEIVPPHFPASFLPTSTENLHVPKESDQKKSSGITSVNLFFIFYFLLLVFIY